MSSMGSSYAILQCTSFSIYRRCVLLGTPVDIVLKGPFGMWPILRVVREEGKISDDTAAVCLANQKAPITPCHPGSGCPVQ